MWKQLKNQTKDLNVSSLHNINKDKTSGKDRDNPNRVFGVTLAKAAQAGGKAIPTVLSECMQFLQREGSLELFLSEPAVKEVEDLKKKYNSAQTVNIQQHSVSTVTSLLLTYLRELPEPIVPFSMYDLFLWIHRCQNEQVKIDYYRHVIDGLTLLNRLVLSRLLLFFNTLLMKNAGTSNDAPPDVKKKALEKATGMKMLSRLMGFSIVKSQSPEVTRRDSMDIYNLVEDLVVDAPMYVAKLDNTKFRGVVRTTQSNEGIPSPISNTLKFQQGEFIFLYKEMESNRFQRGEIYGNIGVFELAHVESTMTFRPPAEDEEEQSGRGAGYVRVASTQIRPPPGVPASSSSESSGKGPAPKPPSSRPPPTPQKPPPSRSFQNLPKVSHETSTRSQTQAPPPIPSQRPAAYLHSTSSVEEEEKEESWEQEGEQGEGDNEEREREEREREEREREEREEREREEREEREREERENKEREEREREEREEQDSQERTEGDLDQDREEERSVGTESSEGWWAGPDGEELKAEDYCGTCGYNKDDTLASVEQMENYIESLKDAQTQMDMQQSELETELAFLRKNIATMQTILNSFQPSQ
eukprot:CAMPEP_0201508714 /NCGR_PEP_ID=MMETSP0161_2-20130828/1988_1 /ASSEMBLY_ACC=CAM_ASM_000251 /TAXON_ID=180227 /ORGANISM="Neoparamoeba aestuarina, Strain SoJaBio B1-5/56/2" /LENGTH=587 /DNA_ID=CAMNT_0047903457 /DNA_START=124 /DNA_END=1887 /DNA_ORIENTATION=-